jgi:Mce-associated membrane protein
MMVDGMGGRVPPRKRASSILNGDAREHHDPDSDVDGIDADVDDGVDPLTLADEADAEAAAAEAEAAAARARARALRLRREAAAAEKRAAAAAVVTPVPAAEPEVETVEPVAEPTPEAVVEEEPSADDDADDPAVVEPTRRMRRRFGRPQSRRSWLTLAAATVAVLVTLGFLGASGYMIVQHRHAAAEQQRSAEFAAAARQGVVTLMSLNFNSAQDDVKRILDNTTGDFKKDFAGQADEFAKVAQTSQVITEATVNATAVQSMSKDTATVLVAVTTQVSNAASKQQEPRSWRLRVDMARDGGQLKLAKVEFVP